MSSATTRSDFTTLSCHVGVAVFHSPRLSIPLQASDVESSPTDRPSSGVQCPDLSDPEILQDPRCFPLPRSTDYDDRLRRIVTDYDSYDLLDFLKAVGNAI